MASEPASPLPSRAVVDRFRLEGRRAVVTGGARGIGRATAFALSGAGAAVVIADRDAAIAEATAQEIAAAGGVAVPIGLDVTDRAAVEAAAARIEETFGPVDVLVNNAGMVLNGASTDVAEGEWRRVLDLNLDAVFWCAQAFGRRMVARGRGAIVNISSICGEIAVRPQLQASYNASKGAVNMLTRSLAAEWGRTGVRVNAVAPGYTATELTLLGRSKPEWFETWLSGTPMGRLGEPSEIAACVLFLASDAASFVTGTILTADGGYTSW